MTVVDITPARKFNPADTVMEALRLKTEDAPGLYRLISDYCTRNPAIAICKAGSAAQADMVDLHLTKVLRPHIAVLRLHHRPFYMLEDELGDAHFCAAAAALLPNKHMDAMRAETPQAILDETGLGQGLVWARTVVDVMGLGIRGIQMAYPQLDDAPKLVFLLTACQYARTYIAMRDTSSPLAAEFRKMVKGDHMRQYRALLFSIGDFIETQPASAMADTLFNLINTARKLEADQTPPPAATTGANNVRVVAFGQPRPANR